MIDQRFLQTMAAVNGSGDTHNGKVEYVGHVVIGRIMAQAEFKAEQGDPVAQRIVVQIGSLCPHLINV